MIAKFLAVAAAGVSAVYAGTGPCSYPPPLANQLTANSVSRPDLNNFPTIGQKYTIVWDATGLGPTATLILLRGPGDNIQYLETIVESAPNTGAYEWTPEAGLTPDTTHYGIMMINDADCKFQWSTQFGINAGSGPVQSPSSSKTWPSSSTKAAPSSSSTGKTWPSVTKSAPVPSETCSEGEEQPPKTWSTAWGSGPWGPPSNTSTSTYWAAATGGAPQPSSVYKPLQANDGARFGMSLVGAAGALAAAFMLI